MFKKFLLKPLLLSFLFLFLSNLTAFATTFYVRPDGNDTNSGLANTPSEAWKTIQRAANTLSAGDIVEIQPGTYNEAVTVTTCGSPDQYIVFRADGEVVIDGQNKRDYCIKLDGANYVRIEGITCRNATNSGILLYNANNNILVRNVSYPHGNKGIQIDPASNDNQLIGNITNYSYSTNSAGSAAFDSSVPNVLQPVSNLENNQQIKGQDSILQSSSDGRFVIDESGRKTLKFAPGEIIVKFKKGITVRPAISAERIAVTGLSSVDALHKKLNVISMDKIFKGRPKALKKAKARVQTALSYDLSNIYKLKIGKKTDVLKAIAMYRQDPNVEYVEPNYIATIYNTYPNDTSFSTQWSLNNTGQTGGTYDADVDAPEAWDITTGNSNVVIAVVDTGVDYTHQDLSANIWNNADETPNNGVDDDGNGFIDDVNGWDFFNQDNNPLDDNNHGSHVSGIASAVTNNTTGIAGVSWNSKIMALKVLGSDGSGYDSDVVNGIAYASDNGADVINLSLGGEAYSYILKDAVDYAYNNNCVIVAAAGNSGNSIPSYPAAYDNTIAVAATDHKDIRTSFSTYGQEIDVAAPGYSIYSILPNNSYGYGTGTSMATPHVSGIAALTLAQNPSLTNNEVIKKIYICADDLGNVGWDMYTGFGRVNAFRALNSESQHYLFARIRGPREGSLFSKSVTITGTAAGSNFDHYEIWVGRGKNPTSWQTTGVTLTGGQVIDGVLATWDCSSLANDFWTIKLISYDKNLNATENRSYVTIDNSLQAGWPQQTIYGGTSIVTGDVDNDGKLEVVTGSYEGNVYIWRYDGTPLPGWPVFVGSEALTPALADLNGDGYLEIIVGTDFPNTSYQDTKLCIFNYDGTPFGGSWPKTRPEINRIVTLPVVADIDGDGDYEIIIAGRDGKIHAWHHNGTVVNGWPVNVTSSDYATTVAVGDIDGDGDVEIIAADHKSGQYPPIGKLYAWHHNGTAVSGWPVAFGGSDFQPVLGDINGDGRLEIVVSGDNGIYAFKADGTILSGWPKYYPIGSNLGTIPCLGDLDNDKIPEVIVYTSNYKFYAWKGDGSVVPGWPPVLDFPYAPPVILGAVVGDIDSDGYNEVIVTLNHFDTWRSYLYIFNHDGTYAAGYPKETDVWWGSIPAITELDEDSNVELIADGWDLSPNGINVYAWDLPGSYDESKMDWPMIGRNAQHTACYPIAPGSISGKVLLQSRSNHSEIITFELRNLGQTVPINTYQVTTAADGSYILNNIEIGTYDLTAKSPNYLRAKQPNITVAAGQQTSNIDFYLLGGDCDGNNVVTGLDFSILRGAYGSRPGYPNWNEMADIDGNNVVTGLDFSILRGNYGKRGTD